MPAHRPRVEPEVAIVGFTRWTRTRVGSRLFTLFFVTVFATIAINLVAALLSA